MQRCKLGMQRIRQTEQRRWGSHSLEPLHQELERDAIAHTALSSAESELYSLVKASVEAMGFQFVIRYLGESWSTVAYRDASAALDVKHREGLERLRQVGCNLGLELWRLLQYNFQAKPLATVTKVTRFLKYHPKEYRFLRIRQSDWFNHAVVDCNFLFAQYRA